MIPVKQNMWTEETRIQLEQAERKLKEYRSLLLRYWQGREVFYMLQSIDQIMEQLSQMRKKLEYLEESIVRAIVEIQTEEALGANKLG